MIMKFKVGDIVIIDKAIRHLMFIDDICLGVPVKVERILERFIVVKSLLCPLL